LISWIIIAFMVRRSKSKSNSLGSGIANQTRKKLD
jgi:hypothetical protein